MTENTIPTQNRRAQIFALLRSTEMDEQQAVRPKYLDETVASQMIGRATSSFRAPPELPAMEAPLLQPTTPVQTPLSNLYARAAQG